MFRNDNSNAVQRVCPAHNNKALDAACLASVVHVSQAQEANAGLLAQVINSVSDSFVHALAALDHRLEDIGLLGKLEEQALPDEVLDEDGEPTTAYKEARHQPWGLVHT